MTKKSKPAKASKEEELKDEEEVEETEEMEEEEETEEEEESSDEEDEEETEDAKSEKPAKASKSIDKKSVDVISRDRIYVRTYSEKVHGKDYLKMAEGLIAHYPRREYSVVPSSEIEAVEVRYREKEDAELPLDKQKLDSPMVDKTRLFTDKEAALSFNVAKKGAIIAKRAPVK